MPLTVEFVKKNFLTYSKEKIEYHQDIILGVNEAELAEFIELLEINILAKEFDVQFNELISKIQRHFNCSELMAEFFYYNNALRIIKDLSILKESDNRVISRKEFISRLDNSEIFYGEWYLARKGKRRHLADLKKEYFSQLNISPFERFFILEINPAIDIRSSIKEIAFLISKKYSKIEKEPKPFCPYVFFHGIDKAELISLKKELIEEEFRIVDGYDFLGADFNVNSIQIPPNKVTAIKLKILNSIENLEETVASITKKTRYIYQFYLTNSICNYKSISVKHIKIQIEKLTDIKDII